MSKKTGLKSRKIKRPAITSEDLKRGFINEIEEPPLTEYLDRHKKRIGLAPGERALTKWK